MTPRRAIRRRLYHSCGGDVLFLLTVGNGRPLHGGFRNNHEMQNSAAASLLTFAMILTRVDAAFAGRAYAAHGWVYIVSSLFWEPL